MGIKGNAARPGKFAHAAIGGMITGIAMVAGIAACGSLPAGIPTDPAAIAKAAADPKGAASALAMETAKSALKPSASGSAAPAASGAAHAPEKKK